MTPYGQLSQARGAKEDARALSASRSKQSVTKRCDPSGTIPKVFPHDGFGPVIGEQHLLHEQDQVAHPTTN